MLDYPQQKAIRIARQGNVKNGGGVRDITSHEYAIHCLVDTLYNEPRELPATYPQSAILRGTLTLL